MNNSRKELSGEYIEAVEKSFRIIQALDELHTAGVSEIARAVNLPKSTVDIHLQTLEKLGYTVKDADCSYRLSLRFLEHGGKIRKQIDLYHVARAQVDKLSNQVSEVATIGFEECYQRVLLYRTEPIEGLSDNAPVGQINRMHWTALGKALLSQLSNEEIDEAIETFGLPEATAQTITDRDGLVTEIERIREQGYSIEDEEHIEGIRSVAVPLDIKGENAAISTVGPKHRVTVDRIENELVEALRETSNIIALKYEYY
ncbi:IclR family transcriptional regulator [Halorhabdus amylolytica]